MIDFARQKPLSLKTVAETFGVHPRTVHRWINRGLESRLVGGLVYTTLEAVNCFSRPHVAGEYRIHDPHHSARVQDAALAIEEMHARYG